MQVVLSWHAFIQNIERKTTTGYGNTQQENGHGVVAVDNVDGGSFRNSAQQN